jgi:hypothetical protein
MNNTIQSLWIGDELSKIEQLSIASFLYHGHTYHLYAYNEISGVPDGTIIKDANAILPRKEIFSYAKIGGYGAFSDWFRYVMIYRHGGYWVDTDVICLKPFDFVDEIVVGQEGTGYLGSAVLRFPQGSPLLAQLIALCEHPNRPQSYDSAAVKLGKLRRFLQGNRRTNIAHGEIGPQAVTNVLRQHQLYGIAKPFYIFYPTSGVQWQAAFDATLNYTLDFFKQCYAIHLWSEHMRLANLDRNATFAPYSLIEQLKRHYLKEQPNLVSP